MVITSSWLEQRRVKKREQDNIEFSKKVVPNWRYKRDGALAKKVCYEGMLPHTRIMVGWWRGWYDLLELEHDDWQ